MLFRAAQSSTTTYIPRAHWPAPSRGLDLELWLLVPYVGLNATLPPLLPDPSLTLHDEDLMGPSGGKGNTRQPQFGAGKHNRQALDQRGRSCARRRAAGCSGQSCNAQSCCQNAMPHHAMPSPYHSVHVTSARAQTPDTHESILGPDPAGTGPATPRQLLANPTPEHLIKPLTYGGCRQPP